MKGSTDYGNVKKWILVQVEGATCYGSARSTIASGMITRLPENPRVRTRVLGKALGMLVEEGTIIEVDNRYLLPRYFSLWDRAASGSNRLNDEELQALAVFVQNPQWWSLPAEKLSGRFRSANVLLACGDEAAALTSIRIFLHRLERNGITAYLRSCLIANTAIDASEFVVQAVTVTTTKYVANMPHNRVVITEDGTGVVSIKVIPLSAS